jgi:hypothetical protein
VTPSLAHMGFLLRKNNRSVVKWLTPRPFGNFAFHKFQSPRDIPASPRFEAFTLKDMHGYAGPFPTLLMDALVFAN